MSTYNGRHGPNVSQYLRDLNTISPQDTTAVEDTFTMEEDLAIFTNTQFFDFDSGQNTDFQAQPVKPDTKTSRSGTASENVSAAPSVIGDMPNLDFISGEFGLFIHLHCYYHFIRFLPLLFATLSATMAFQCATSHMPRRHLHHITSL